MRTLTACCNIIILELGALFGIGALIYKNTFGGGAYSKGAAYWKKATKSNHYGN